MPEPQPPRRSGAVPEEYLQRVIADAAQLAGVPPDRFEVTRAEAVQWRDSSLGCPKPGVVYLQVITDGYWVELAVDGRRFDYRLDARGTFHLCQRPMVGSPLYPDR